MIFTSSLVLGFKIAFRASRSELKRQFGILGITTMYHTIVFVEEIMADLEISRKKPLECVLIRKGARVQVQLKPYVIKTNHGFVEVADLFFEDGTATRALPFAFFSFID
jgi:hypothetical protein